jgi:hypothetical protein
LKGKAYSDSSTKGKSVIPKTKDKRRTLTDSRGFKSTSRYYPYLNGRIIRKFGDSYESTHTSFKKVGDFYYDSNNSKYLGRHPLRIGSRGQKYGKVGDPMFELFHLNREVFDSVNLDIDKYLIMSGSYESNKHILQRTMIPEYEIPTPESVDDKYIRSYDKVVKSVLRKILNFSIEDANFSDFQNVFFNKDTLPGFHYQYMLGHNSKEESYDAAYLVGKSKWNYIESCCRLKKKLEREKLFTTTYTIGARNKRDIPEENGEIVTSRAIHMPEFHDELCSSPWIDKITDNIIEQGKGPIYIGNSYVRYERFVKDCSDSTSYVEGDWKRFDSTLYFHMILIGVSILRCFYPLNSKRADYHFTSIFDSLSIKDYYTPGGFIYRLYHGIPSGVKCTNLLGSIINLVALMKCTEDVSPKRKKFCIGGDDHLIIFEDKIVKEDYLEKIKERAKEIGMTFKFLLIKDFKSKKSDDRPVFYKYTIDRGEPIIPASSLLERCFIPWNKSYGNNEKCFEFLKEVMPSLGAPRSTHLLYYALYKSVYKRLFQVDISYGEILSLHDSVYRRVMREKIETYNRSPRGTFRVIPGTLSKEGILLRNSFIRGA